MQRQWRCTGQRGLFSFPKENSPLYIPQEKGSHWQLALAACCSKKCDACGMIVPAWRHCFARRHWCCSYDLSLLLLPAVAQPLAALPPYGCGTAGNRRKSSRLDTKLGRHFHSRGAALLQAPNCQCRGSRGTPLAFLWGFQKGYSLRKENTPFGWQQRPALHCKPARSAENTLRPHRAEARMQRITLQCSNPPPVRRRSPRTAPWRRARQTARSWRPWRFRAACR